jgi:phosphoribosyl 1,2-cyclic phosphate phosphodiesterase
MNDSASLRFTILGSGTSTGVPVIGCQCATCLSSDQRDKRLRTSVMAESNGKRFIIDASNDFRMQMLSHDVRAIDAMLFTHHHYDHISGFDDIRALNYVTRKPMECYATEATFQQLKKFFSYAFPEKDSNKKSEGGGIPQTVLHTITPAAPFIIDGISITPIPLKHGSLEVMGFRIGNIAYCTDCNAIPDASWELFRGVEYLVIDALRYEKHTTHFNVEEATAAAERIGARMTYFTHIAHEIKHEEAESHLPQNIRIAYDGLVIEGNVNAGNLG